MVDKRVVQSICDEVVVLSWRQSRDLREAEPTLAIQLLVLRYEIKRKDALLTA